MTRLTMLLVSLSLLASCRPPEAIEAPVVDTLRAPSVDVWPPSCSRVVEVWCEQPGCGVRSLRSAPCVVGPPEAGNALVVGTLPPARQLPMSALVYPDTTTCLVWSGVPDRTLARWEAAQRRRRLLVRIRELRHLRRLVRAQARVIGLYMGADAEDGAR